MIQFRIDDTQGDYYDLISYAYTDDGSTWHTIQDSNIHGVKQWLVSNKKDASNIVTHQILWDTTGYSLTPSSTYRIKINATYTKYNQGDQPTFHWQATINPLIDYYQDELFVLNGGKQYYKKTREDFVKIQNKDGTVSYQQVQNPKQTWVKIQPYEYYFYDENGNKLYVQGGEYTQRNGKYYDQNNVLVMQIRDYAIVDGRLQDQQKKLQQVKGRPTKTIVQNGVSKTINWGYLQFCNQNGQLVDKTGYAKWLAQNDPVYGYKRSVVINQIQSEINDIKQKITYYKNKILQCQMKNRRQLIKQGFYSNGFLYNSYNQSDPTDFVFRLKSKPTTKLQSEFVKNQTGYGLYEIKYNLQLDFFDTFDSQYENKPLRDFYNYQVNNIVLDITAGVDKDDLENSNLYKGDFIINNDYLPGKQQFDYNPLKDVYSYQYFWRIRPYVSFQEAKKQVVFTKIKEITQDDNYVYMLFDVCGKSDLGTVQLQAIYYQTKTTDDNYIQLIEPVYQNDYYYHFYQPQKHPLEQQQSNVYFLTDRLRDQDGYLRQRKNSYLNWTSFTTNRQRPQVLIVDNQYYMFYDKKSSSGQNLIYLARSKNGTQFGEYSQIFPYLTFNKLKETELVSQNVFSQTSSSVSNPFVLRKENKFLVFADAKTKTILNENKNRILLFQSDYSGDIFETPVICNGIQGYICPSVFVISGVIEQKDENNQSVYTQKQFYIMACMKPYQNYISQNQSQNSFESDSSVNENTIIQFFVSEDRKTWSKTNELMDVDFGKYQTLLDNGIYNTDLIKYDSDYCLSPFVYKNEQQLWVYYCIYEGVFHSNSIYRVKYNFVSNTWSQPTFIINNAFNPTVVQDCYFGNNYHRLYYNTKIKTKLNGKDVDQIVVNNCFITNIKLQNEQGDFHYCQLNNVVVSSTQYSYASKNNIQVGYNQQCANCNATGYVYKNEQQIVCDKCNGNGIIQFIQYKLRIPKRNFQLNWEWDSTVDNYVEKDNAEYLNLNYILALKPKYDTKTYYQYGQWYDYNHANQFQRKIVPDRRWNYLQV